MPKGLLYFSNLSGNTKRFVEKIEGIEPLRIPIFGDFTEALFSDYILVTPTYGNGRIPTQVVRVLNSSNSRNRIKAVIGSGNRNFGKTFARAADVIAEKLKIPVIHKFELLGSSEDVLIVSELLREI